MKIMSSALQSSNVTTSDSSIQPSQTLQVGSSVAGSTITSIQQLDSSDGIKKTLDALKRLGVDSQNIAQELTSTLKSVVKQRPDLANAQFDFVSDHGQIKVVSQNLSASDRSWLQDKLNSNSGLVSGVNGFNSDMMTAYSGSFDDSNPYAADGAVSFMNLFGRTAKEFQSGIFVNATDNSYLSGSDGSPLDLNDLAQEPGTAAGMIRFMDRVQSVESGGIKIVSAKTHLTECLVPTPNLFGNAGYFPLQSLLSSEMSVSQLGLHVRA